MFSSNNENDSLKIKIRQSKSIPTGFNLKESTPEKNVNKCFNDSNIILSSFVKSDLKDWLKIKNGEKKYFRSGTYNMPLIGQIK